MQYSTAFNFSHAEIKSSLLLMFTGIILNFRKKIYNRDKFISRNNIKFNHCVLLTKKPKRKTYVVSKRGEKKLK